MKTTSDFISKFKNLTQSCESMETISSGNLKFLLIKNETIFFCDCLLCTWYDYVLCAVDMLCVCLPHQLVLGYTVLYKSNLVDAHFAFSDS